MKERDKVDREKEKAKEQLRRMLRELVETLAKEAGVEPRVVAEGLLKALKKEE